MKNFIFKSTADFHKILFNQLKMILDEQRHQRSDLALIIRLLKKEKVDSEIQKQVDDYFLPLEDNTKDIPEE